MKYTLFWFVSANRVKLIFSSLLKLKYISVYSDNMLYSIIIYCNVKYYRGELYV